jgi:predicted O-methyltransferase YrrM
MYQHLAAHGRPGLRTLETGLGISTALFADLGCEHSCVVGDADQVERLRAWADGKVSLDRVSFYTQPSYEVLPGLDGPLDLVLIDGGHGYPHPIIDWFYTARRLVPGGTMIVDDTQLPSIRDYLIRFLEEDPRWERIDGSTRWVAYRRDDHDLVEEWDQQTFLGTVKTPSMKLFKVAINRRLPARLRR